MEERSYRGYDALRMAMEMERKGGSFYGSLAEKVSHSSLKDIFKQLAVEEEYHIKVMEEKLLPLCESEEAYWADEELMAEHLERMMEGGAFPDERRVFGRVEKSGSEQDAIHLAIRSEKDSLELYKKAREATGNEEGKKAFALLVEEEDKHLRLLLYWQKELAEHGSG